MKVTNGTHILVTDGRKMLLFRNEGDSEYPQFIRLAEEEDDNPPDREQKSDAPGHLAVAGMSGRRGAFQEADFHRQEETRFSRRTADLLNRRAAAGEIDRLVVVADPRTLGELRDRFSPLVERTVVAEVAKDLVKHPVTAIERILCGGRSLR